jgi:hypothetical protein
VAGDTIQGGLLIELPGIRRLVASIGDFAGWSVVQPHLTVYGRNHSVGRAILERGPAYGALSNFDGRSTIVRILTEPWYCKWEEQESVVFPARAAWEEADGALARKSIVAFPPHPGHHYGCREESAGTTGRCSVPHNVD